MSEYSTKTISTELLNEIGTVLQNKGWGSIEVYIENYEVVQITDRTIRKTRKKKESRGS